MREESAPKTPHRHAHTHAHQDKQREAGAEASQAGSPPREVWLLQPVKVSRLPGSSCLLTMPHLGPKILSPPSEPWKNLGDLGDPVVRWCGISGDCGAGDGEIGVRGAPPCRRLPRPTPLDFLEEGTAPFPPLTSPAARSF